MTILQDFYKEYAQNSHNIISDPHEANIYINALLTEVVDLVYENKDLALLMLYKTQNIQNRFEFNLANLYTGMLVATRSLNVYYTDEFGDLTTYVNNIPWDDGYVPYYWANLSERSGTDTSDWNINPSA